LLRLLDTPEDIPTLAPLAEREILYRLLKGEEGWRLRQMAVAQSHSKRIARAIEWLKAHYAEPLRIAELAKNAGMSASSFHEHFPGGDRDEPAPVPEAPAPARGAPVAARGSLRCRDRRPPRGLREPQPVQPRVQPHVRVSPAADARRLRAAT
jgi:hypothetical protein